ncbi:MAG: helix-turn-helix transcriptional regulator [Desulfobacteraceae bacterium]|nr:helix-turn-helix transcriptional regulator [Desulfobacteraceae bacterium]
MIIYHVKDLMLKKSALERRKITYADVEKEANVSKITLTRLASNKNHSVRAEIIEKLCLYFNCSPDKLMTILPDAPEKEKGMG